MRVEVQYRLFDLVEDRYIDKGYDHFTVITVQYNEDERQFFESVKKELSRTINKPIESFKVLGYEKL